MLLSIFLVPRFQKKLNVIYGFISIDASYLLTYMSYIRLTLFTDSLHTP